MSPLLDIISVGQNDWAIVCGLPTSPEDYGLEIAAICRSDTRFEQPSDNTAYVILCKAPQIS